MADIPEWHIVGDWFDACNCSIPCPCTFAQRPTHGDCDGVLAWHIRRGSYGDVTLDGLSVMGLSHFVGNIWEGESTPSIAMFFDESANRRQRAALMMIFGGRAGGWPGFFFSGGDLRGTELVHIDFHVDEDLASWQAEIPGKITARGEALDGPTTPPGKRVQLHNASGSETGPGGIATFGRSIVDKAEAFGFKWNRKGLSSKHIGFDWSGPDG